MPEVLAWESSARRLSLDVNDCRDNRDARPFLSSVAAFASRFGSRMNVGESWIPADLADIGGRVCAGYVSFLAGIETTSY